jgi:hypothetical protein
MEPGRKFTEDGAPLIDAKDGAHGGLLLEVEQIEQVGDGRAVRGSVPGDRRIVSRVG